MRFLSMLYINQIVLACLRSCANQTSNFTDFRWTQMSSKYFGNDLFTFFVFRCVDAHKSFPVSRTISIVRDMLTGNYEWKDAILKHVPKNSFISRDEAIKHRNAERMQASVYTSNTNNKIFRSMFVRAGNWVQHKKSCWTIRQMNDLSSPHV